MQYFPKIVMISNYHGNYKQKLYNLWSKSAEFDYVYLSLCSKLSYLKIFLADTPRGKVKHNYKHNNSGCSQ